ncbi:MAG: hypothetical protein HY928_17055, partial [Elusimicrobia bacterium]|nr:hypothetical protein [Elusimicrobiota bacterium]
RPATAEEAAAWGGRAVLGGVDAAEDSAAAGRDRAAAERAAAETAAALERSEFVLVGADGRPRQALDLAALRRLEAEGRVLYFSAKPDRDGRRRALHAVEARQRGADEVVVVVARTGEAPPAGRYETLDAALRSPEGAALERLEAGARGLSAMAREAERQAESSGRLGWISLKLEAHGYALGPDGRVVAVFMAEEELTKAREDLAKLDAKDPRRAWTFHHSCDLVWELAADGSLAAVSSPGAPRLSFGTSPARRVAGKVIAAELDAEGRLVKVFQDEAAFKAAAAKWWIEDLEGRVWKQGDGKIAPLHRLKRYIDPETRLPVRLGHDLLKRRLDEAADELGDVGRWAYMPWNWANIVLEIPRGIVQAPIELITGRDPNQNGYLGRVYMYRRDGGGTVRRGALGRAVHFLDIFEILPDPVARYMDPSQFPREVFNPEPLLPGRWEHEVGPRIDSQDIHFGAGTMLRFVRWAREDIEDARGRILGSFDGGVRSVFLETVRGRAGSYDEARLEYRTGSDAVEAALREAGAALGAGGDGRLEAAPDHIEVERVTAELSVTLGARQLAERARRLREAAERLAASPRADRAAELYSEAERLEADLRAERERLEEARRAFEAVRPPLEKVLLRTTFPPRTLLAR